MTNAIEAALGKLDTRLCYVSDAARAAGKANEPAALLILADAERALKRIAKRAEEVPEGWEQVELPQAHGPTLEYLGKLLAETAFQVMHQGEPLKVRLELWESKAGAMIPVTYRSRSDGHDEEIEAAVIEPDEDAQRMRFDVMSAWDWGLRARSLVRKLGWSLRQDVA